MPRPGPDKEQLNKEIRRRTDVVGIFPGCEAPIRLVSAMVAEESGEWTEGDRYTGLELLAKSRIRIVTTEPEPTAGEPTATAQALTT